MKHVPVVKMDHGILIWLVTLCVALGKSQEAQEEDPNTNWLSTKGIQQNFCSTFRKYRFSFSFSC